MIGVKEAQVRSPGSLSANQLAVLTANYLQAGDDPEIVAAAMGELNLAIDRVNERNWNKLIDFYNVPLLADYTDYGVPVQFREPLHAEFLDTDLNPVRKAYYLPLKNFLEETAMRSATNADKNIFHYTYVYNTNRIWLDRPPSLSFVGELPYLSIMHSKRLLHLVSTFSVHGGPPEFNNYLVWAARGAIAESWGEVGKADRAFAKAEMRYKTLKEEDAKMLSDFATRRWPLRSVTNTVSNPYRW